MVVDCRSCSLRDLACRDCVVTVLAIDGGRGTSSYVENRMLSAGFELGAEERAAVEVLADAGLVPRLRLVDTARRESAGGGDFGRSADRRPPVG